MRKVKSLIITGFGINCEEELTAAYNLSGAITKQVHLNDIFLGKETIHNYDILNFPGGFSFGDDLGSGKVLANKMKYKQIANGNLFFDEIRNFIAAGKYILGICNGFQFLVKMGLLPNLNGRFEQEVTLTHNDSGKFEDRWSYLNINKLTITPFLKKIETIFLPIRHGEGKLIIKDENIREQIVKNNLNCMSYCKQNGDITAEYPANPNGSELNCAALTDKSGHILGMMPHPEAFLSLYNHPNWNQIISENENHSEKGQGLQIFENIVNYIERKKSEKSE